MQEAEEAGSTEAPKLDEWAQLTQAEIELSALITESLEPIQKECMHWEKRILHSASICFPKAGDAIKAYNSLSSSETRIPQDKRELAANVHRRRSWGLPPHKFRTVAEQGEYAESACMEIGLV